MNKKKLSFVLIFVMYTLAFFYLKIVVPEDWQMWAGVMLGVIFSTILIDRWNR